MKFKCVFPVVLLLLAAPCFQQTSSSHAAAQSVAKPRLGEGELIGVLDDGMDKAIVRGEYGCILCDRLGGSSKHQYVTGITVRIGLSYQSFFFVAPATIISGGELRKGTSVKVTYKNLVNDKRNVGHFFTGEALTISVLSANAQSSSTVTPRQDGLANVKKQVNAKLEDLKASILRKIDNDVTSTALSFTEAEYISRSLRVAYPFKAALTVISGAISSIGALKNVFDIKTAFNYQNTALGAASIYLAYQNAVKAGEDLKFVFDGPAYTDSVERMIKDAQATQTSIGPIPAAGFDSATYRAVIENWVVGNGSGSLYLRISPDRLRRPCGKNSPDSLFGVLALKTRLSSAFKEIEGQISKGSYSQEQLMDVERQVASLKTAILASSGKAATASYQTYQLNSQGGCELSQKEIPLGTIAQYDIALRQAYAALDKRVQVEQAFTLTTVAGAVVKTVSLKVGNNASLSIASKLLGVEKLGEYAFSKKFPLSTPRDAVVNLPQEMLLALPGELSSVWAIVQDLSSYVETTSAKSVADNSSPVKNEIRQVDFKNFTYQLEGRTVQLRNGKRPARNDNEYSINDANTSYGDVTGDGQEEAVIILRYDGGGTGSYTFGYLYSVQNGRPILLTTLKGGDRADGGIVSANIENELLILKRNVPEKENGVAVGLCCPKYVETVRYRWDGRGLVEVDKTPNNKRSASGNQPNPNSNSNSPVVTNPNQSPTLYEDPGACPFECCTYRRWTVTAQTSVRQDRQSNSPVAFTLRRGERATGMTGVVITTQPGQARVLKPIVVGGVRVKPGEIVYLLTNLGEGFQKVWYKGKVASIDVSDETIFRQLKRSESVWWVKVKNSKGQIGWTDQTKNFTGMDACG